MNISVIFKKNTIGISFLKVFFFFLAHPAGWIHTLPDQRWISKALFRWKAQGHPEYDLSKVDKLWWYPPQVPLQTYNLPPLENYFGHPLLLWMPRRLWQVKLTCPGQHPDCQKNFWPQPVCARRSGRWLPKMQAKSYQLEPWYCFPTWRWPQDAVPLHSHIKTCWWSWGSYLDVSVRPGKQQQPESEDIAGVSHWGLVLIPDRMSCDYSAITCHDSYSQAPMADASLCPGCFAKAGGNQGHITSQYGLILKRWPENLLAKALAPLLGLPMLLMKMVRWSCLCSRPVKGSVLDRWSKGS